MHPDRYNHSERKKKCRQIWWCTWVCLLICTSHIHELVKTWTTWDITTICKNGGKQCSYASETHTIHVLLLIRGTCVQEHICVSQSVCWPLPCVCEKCTHWNSENKSWLQEYRTNLFGPRKLSTHYSKSYQSIAKCKVVLYIERGKNTLVNHST